MCLVQEGSGIQRPGDVTIARLGQHSDTVKGSTGLRHGRLGSGFITCPVERANHPCRGEEVAGELILAQRGRRSFDLVSLA